MQRRPSSLLHDYKVTIENPEPKRGHFRWFALGLGIPLLVTAALSLSKRDAIEEQTVFVETDESVVTGEELALEEIEEVVFTETASSLPLLSDFPEFHPPLSHPEPDYAALRVTIQRGDTLDRIFRKNDLNLAHLAQISRLPEAREHLRMLKPGDEIEIRHDDGELLSLERTLGIDSALRVAREEEEFAAELVERPVEVRQRMAYGRIKSSLFESAAAASLSDKLIMNLAGIFAWDIDFVLDIRTDDNYYIVYEELWQDGEMVGDGEIVAAEFNNNGRQFQAVRYISADGRSDYFTPEGRSVRKAFIRAPVDFTRISSNFNPNRRHPILNTIRAHRGVDYAAPQGTAIKAAGDGKVIFRGVKSGYGNVVILQHGGNITTLYAHMSGFAKDARVGRRVRQGQTIGFVGKTGLATAPHLHYEYRLSGVHRNPRTVPLPQAEPIKRELMQDFLAAAEPILTELEQFKRTRVAAVSAD